MSAEKLEHHQRPCDNCKKNCIRVSEACEEWDRWFCSEWRWVQSLFGVDPDRKP